MNLLFICQNRLHCNIPDTWRKMFLINKKDSLLYSWNQQCRSLWEAELNQKLNICINKYAQLHKCTLPLATETGMVSLMIQQLHFAIRCLSSRLTSFNWMIIKGFVELCFRKTDFFKADFICRELHRGDNVYSLQSDVLCNKFCSFLTSVVSHLQLYNWHLMSPCGPRTFIFCAW